MSEPPLPSGPGVAPPFAAPPTDRDNKMLWIGLGIGAVVLVLCCVGGLFGIGALYAAGTKEASNQAEQLVASYLESLRQENYPAAYNLLCANLKSDQSLAEFTAQQSRMHVRGFRIDAVHTDQTPYVVEATVTYQETGTVTREYAISTSLSGGGMTICGER